MTQEEIEKVFDEYIADMKATTHPDDEDFFTQFEILAYDIYNNKMCQMAVSKDIKKYLRYEDWVYACISKGFGRKYITLITVNNYCYILRRTDVTVLA